MVIVDDGSRPPLEAPADSPLQVSVVHQEDLGFGLARARNTGARAAAHGILVFLDCDMMPEAGWLSEHARWHHTASDLLTLGFRSHVDVAGIDAEAVRSRSGSLDELFADRPSQRPAWIEFHMARTDDLTSDDDDIFRIVTGGNLGVSREFFETVGCYDESFTPVGHGGHRVRLPGLHARRAARPGARGHVLASGRGRGAQRIRVHKSAIAEGQDLPTHRPLRIQASGPWPELYGASVCCDHPLERHRRDRPT